MNNTPFPHCPIADCPGTTVLYAYSIGKGVYETKYYRCPACGELMAGRKLTDEEKARAAADKAAKRERKKRKTQAQLLEEYRAERARLEALPQLPVEGWSPREWFPSLGSEAEGALPVMVNGELQMRFIL